MATGSGGGGGSAGAIRAGAAFVELYSTDGKLRAGLARAKAMVASFSAKMAGVGAATAAAGAAMLAPLVGFFKEGVSKAAELNDIAGIFGMTAEQASRMAYAFEVTGNSVEDLKKVLGKLSETAEGKPLDEHFLSSLKQVLAVEDAAERMAQAREKFGDKLAFKILDAGQDLERLMNEAPLISKESMENAEAFEQSLNKVGAAVRASLVPLVETLAPVAEWFAKLVRENSELARYAMVAGAALVVIGGGLIAIAGVAMGASAVVTGLTTAFAALSAVVAFFMTPVGLVILGVAAVTAAIVALVAFTDTGRETFKSLAETFSAAWGGIVNAISTGDFSQAFQIAWDAVKVIWAKAVLALTKMWNSFKEGIVDSWHEVTDAIAIGWSHVAGTVAEVNAQIKSEKEARAAARKASEDAAAEDVRKAEEKLKADTQYAATKKAFGAIAKFKDEPKPDLEDRAKEVASQISATRGGFQAGNFSGAFGGSSILASLIKDGNKSQAATAKNTKDILAAMKGKSDDEEVFE